MIRALIKGQAPNYDEVYPETEWGTWTRNHLNYYTNYYGYTLINNYEPPVIPEE